VAEITGQLLVLVDSEVGGEGRLDGEGSGTVRALVRFLLCVDPDVTNEIARFLESPDAPVAVVEEAAPLPHPGPHHVLPHLPVHRLVSQDYEISSPISSL